MKAAAASHANLPGIRRVIPIHPMSHTKENSIANAEEGQTGKGGTTAQSHDML